MNREALDSLDKEALFRLVLTQAETIAALNRQVEMLTARLSRLEADNGALRAENAALREKLKLPPKTPDNSSTPPSQGRKPSADPAAASGSTGRRTSHPGAHRPLHPDPTRKRIDIRYIVTSVRGHEPEHLYETLYCARGQAENLIKQHKAQLASDRTSCRSPFAN